MNILLLTLLFVKKIKVRKVVKGKKEKNKGTVAAFLMPATVPLLNLHLTYYFKPINLSLMSNTNV